MDYLAKIRFKIYKGDSKYVPYEIEDLEILDDFSTNGYDVKDDIWLFGTDGAEFSEIISKMEIGQELIIEGDFYGEWCQDYWGEWNSNFELRNEKIVEK